MGHDFKGVRLEVEPFKARATRDPSLTRHNNLFVKNIPKKMTHQELRDLFQPFGKIISAVVIKDREDLPENKGFGFVCFETTEMAKLAEEGMKTKQVEGQTLYIARALSKEDHKKQVRDERMRVFKDCNLYVKELPEDINDESLKKAFEEFGRVVSARVILERKQMVGTDKIELKPRGYGFVCFSNKEEAKNAMNAARSKDILGRRMYVAVAEKKEDRVARCVPNMYQYPPRGPAPYYMPPSMFPQPYQRMPRGRYVHYPRSSSRREGPDR